VARAGQPAAGPGPRTPRPVVVAQTGRLAQNCVAQPQPPRRVQRRPGRATALELRAQRAQSFPQTRRPLLALLDAAAGEQALRAAGQPAVPQGRHGLDQEEALVPPALGLIRQVRIAGEPVLRRESALARVRLRVTRESGSVPWVPGVRRGTHFFIYQGLATKRQPFTTHSYLHHARAASSLRA